MNNDTPKTLSKVALDVDTVIQRGVREDCKDVGFNYDDKVNNAIYLLCVGEVLKIDRKGFCPHWVKRDKEGFLFFQGDVNDDTFATWWSKSKIAPHKMEI